MMDGGTVTWLWHIAGGFAAGAAAGAGYVSGLWWTTRRLPRTSRPRRMALASYGVRMAALGAAFAGLAAVGPAALLGFLVGLHVAGVGIVLVRMRSGERP